METYQTMDSMEIDNALDAELSFRHQQRLVHLDLKGAPPRLEYYKEIFPLIKSWGGNGLLVEYEDMFPYSGDLIDIPAKSHYSQDDISELLQIAEENKLTVIPLIQTFGHFEFVLKLEKFKQLREVEEYPMALCPRHPESLTLISEMIRQVMKLHPEAKWFHIGADEVFHIGLCPRCKMYMQENSLKETSELFISHVKSVLRIVRSQFPNLKIIMWDDMLREVPQEILIESGLGDLVEPMVWYYGRTFERLPLDIWDKFSMTFDYIWTASAFKGATGPCMFVTDIGFHVENHRGWIKIIKENQHKFKAIRGCALTGWQRYDHYAVLCELLPVALPSLAICLKTLTAGHFTEKVHTEASMDLNSSEIISLNPFLSCGAVLHCSFPGESIFIGAQHLLHLKTLHKEFFNNDRLNGWMTDYHIKHNFTNPAHINSFLSDGKQLLREFKQLQAQMEVAMGEVFFADCVEEWIEVNISGRISKLEEIIEKAENQLQNSAQPKIKDII